MSVRVPLRCNPYQLRLPPSDVLQLAVGPLGRNAEGMGGINTKGNVAAM